jgi:hypothetical protein
MSITVNGTTLSSMGITVRADGVDGWSDGLSLGYDAIERSGEGGPIESDTVAAKRRRVEITGMLTTTTIAGRNAVIQAALVQMRGLVELGGFTDHADMVLSGRLVGCRTESLGRDTQFLGGVPLVVRLTFDCHDPRWRDATASEIVVNATARDVPLGTATTDGSIEINGTATNPTITVKDYRGITVASLGFTGSLAADESWIIDLEDHSVTLSDSGVLSSANDKVTSGAFWEWDPAWSDYGASDWPTIEVDSGDGTLTYYRRWRA